MAYDKAPPLLSVEGAPRLAVYVLLTVVFTAYVAGCLTDYVMADEEVDAHYSVEIVTMDVWGGVESAAEAAAGIQSLDDCTQSAPTDELALSACLGTGIVVPEPEEPIHESPPSIDDLFGYKPFNPAGTGVWGMQR